MWVLIGIGVAFELILLVAALLDWSKQPKDLPNRNIWLLVIIFINTIGPIAYFLVGPREGNRELLDEPWKLEG